MTFYHAHLEYGNSGHLWANMSEERITENLVLPFINGQVITLNTSTSEERQEKLFNMKNATFLRLFTTVEPLTATAT